MKLYQNSCGETGALCKCDVSQNGTKWQQDEGHLTNKDQLPVVKLNFGGLGLEVDDEDAAGSGKPRREARFQLGPLYCSGADPGEPGGGGSPTTGSSPSSCRDIWLRGNNQVIYNFLCIS